MARTNINDFRQPGTFGQYGDAESSFPFADGRCVRLTAPDTFALPAAGGDVDAVTGVFYVGPTGRAPDFWFYYFPAVPGHQVQVEAGGSFASGALLDTQADGRVVAHGTGKPILRALQAGSAGQLIWAVFTSGR
jgi:hypothetical protein